MGKEDKINTLKKEPNVVFTILGIAFIILMFFVGWFFGGKFAKIEDSIIEKASEKKENKQEKEISDTNIIDELKTKVGYLEYSFNNTSKHHIIENLYIDEEINELSDDVKKKIAIINTNDENTLQITGNDDIVNLLNDRLGPDGGYTSICTNPLDPINGCPGPHYRSEKEFLDIYHSLFNEKVEFEDSDVETDWDIECNCSRFTYFSQLGAYVESNGCGYGIAPGKLLSYINKYTTKGDEAYVYVNVGMVKADDDSDNKFIVYSGHRDDSVVVEEFEYAIDDYNNISYEINEGNYEKFDQFKFTFKKDKKTGNYYFVNIKKINI